MTGKQMHAPPNEAEETALAKRVLKRPRPFATWLTPAGWCSACLTEEERPVVMFGSRERFVGMCGRCITKVSATLTGSADR